MKRYFLFGMLLTIIVMTTIAFIMLRYAGNGTSRTVLEAIEAVRGEGIIDYVIHERETSGGVLVFYLRMDDDGQVVTCVEFVRKVGKGWKWVHGGGHSHSSIRMNLTDEEAGNAFFSAELSLPGGLRMDREPFPLVYGVVVHPEISRIVVEDRHTGMLRQADIVEITDKFKLYYTMLGTLQSHGSQGQGWNVIGYDREGNEMKTATLEPNRSWSSSNGEISR